MLNIGFALLVNFSGLIVVDEVTLEVGEYFVACDLVGDVVLLFELLDAFFIIIVVVGGCVVTLDAASTI